MNIHIFLVLVWAVVVPMILLSLRPHQEARFLLPTVTPLVTLMGSATLKTADRQVRLTFKNMGINGIEIVTL